MTEAINIKNWKDPTSLRRCRRLLLRWFAANARDLPWRRDCAVYAVWISEIMLQQTQVQQALPYYLRFMERFPTVAALAAAPIDAVLKAWEGMGYYARARNLHRAAGQIMARHGGHFPADAESVRALAGIGPYTAAAILSIAFNQPLAVVDGNVIRVLSRLHAWPGDAKTTSGKKEIQERAQSLLDPAAPGAFNEAMMELGALICTPQNPLCTACPLAACCQALAQGAPEKFPVKSAKKLRPHYQIAAGLIWKKEKLLIVRRPESGLLGGLWELPGGKQEAGEVLEATVAREAAKKLGIKIKVGSFFSRVDHAYTHFSITLHVYHCRHLKGTPYPHEHSDWRWVSIAELDDYAFSRSNRRIIEQLPAGAYNPSGL